MGGFTFMALGTYLLFINPEGRSFDGEVGKRGAAEVKMKGQSRFWGVVRQRFPGVLGVVFLGLGFWRLRDGGDGGARRGKGEESKCETVQEK